MRSSKLLTPVAAVLLLTATARADEPCPAGTEPKEGAGCVPKLAIECPAGTFFEEGRGCVAKVVECPAGMVVEANKCVPKPSKPVEPAKPRGPAEPEQPAPPPEPEGPPNRFSIGLRVGFAVPLLNAYRDARDNSLVPLSGELHGALPIGLELGYHVLDALYVGAFGSFGPAFPRKASDGHCSSSATGCTGEQLRVGVHARLYPIGGPMDAPGRRPMFAPWVGLGFGYERLTMREEGTTTVGQTGTVTQTLSGFEFFDLSAGADYTLLENLRVGPFLSFTLAQYGDISTEESTGSGTNKSDRSITNASPHAWLVLGARGAFGLF